MRIKYNYEEEEFELRGRGVSAPAEVEFPAAYAGKIERNMISGTLKKAEAFWSQNEELIGRLRVAKWMDFVKQFIDIDFPNNHTGDHLFIQAPTPKVLEVFEGCITKAEEIQSNREAKEDKSHPHAKFVGSPGDRLEDTLTLTDSITKKSVTGQRELWTLTKFENSEGCQFVTFGAVPDCCTQNSDGINRPVRLRFTVKEHSRFNGVKQNMINRLFVIEAPTDYYGEGEQA